MFNCDIKDLATFVTRKREKKSGKTSHILQLYIKLSNKQNEVLGEEIIKYINDLQDLDNDQLMSRIFEVQFVGQLIHQSNKTTGYELDFQHQQKYMKLCLSLSTTKEHQPLVQKSLVQLLKRSTFVQELFLDYLSMDNLTQKLIIQTYLSVNNVNDVTDQILQEIQASYKTLFETLDLFGQTKYRKESQGFQSLLRVLFDQLIKYFYFDGESQQILDSHIPQQLSFRFKPGQDFAIKLFYEIRQYIFAWLLKSFAYDSTFQEIFKTKFTQKYVSTQLEEGDLKLSPQECVKIIEFINFNHNINLNDEVYLSSKFWGDLTISFNSFQDLTNSKICVHLLTSILTAIHQTNKDPVIDQILNRYRLFADLYITLDSFGTHLTKVVWNNLDEFLGKFDVQTNNPLIRYLLELEPLAILISKSLNHNNDKTIKNCFKSLFKKKIDFTYHKNLIINKILPIVNSSVLYKDAPLETDSRFYKLITGFFQTNMSILSEEVYSEFVVSMLEQFLVHIKYQHAIAALSGVFVRLERQTKALNGDHVVALASYVQQYSGMLNIKKRVQLYNGALALILRHLGEHGESHIFTFVNAFSIDSLSWQTTADSLQHHNEDQIAYYSDCIQYKKKLKDLLSKYVGQQPHVPQEQPDHIKLSVMLTLIYQDIQFIEPYLYVGALHSSAYEPYDTKFKKLNNLSYVLKHTHQHFDQDQRLIVYKILNQQADEIFVFLNGFIIGFQDNSSHEDFVPLIQELLGLIFAIGLNPLVINEAGSLTNNMTKFIGFLFKDSFTVQDWNYRSVLIQLLIVIYETTYQGVFKSKQDGLPILFEELLLVHGLDLLEKLQQGEIPRNIKNNLLHLTCKVMSLHQELNQQNEKFERQIQLIGDDSLGFADRFNAYDSVILFDFLRIVYVPNLVQRSLIGEDVGPELKSLALQSFESMMAVFGSHTQIKEMLSFIDFAVSPHLFESEQLFGTVSQIIQVILRDKVKQWILQRKIINNLVIALVKYPHAIYAFKSILLKMIKGNEPRGYDSSIVLAKSELQIPNAEYIKTNTDIWGDFYGAYPRFQVFALLDWVATQIVQNLADKYWQQIYVQLKDILVDIIRLAQGKRYITGYMEYNKYFRVRLHYWQLLCCLKRLFHRQNLSSIIQPEQLPPFLKELEKSIWGAFNQQNHPMVRQYMEIMIIDLTDQYPDIWLPRVLSVLSDRNIKTNIMIPMVFIGCIHMRHHPYESNISLFNKIFPMVSCNVAYIRSLAQTSCLAYIKKLARTFEHNVSIQEFVAYFDSNKECIKIIKNIESQIVAYDELLKTISLDQLLSVQFDSFGEIIHKSIIDIIKDTCVHTISEIKGEDGHEDNKPPAWVQYVEANLKNLQKQNVKESEAINFQRKIDFIMDTFSLFQSFRPRQTVGDLIVVATLLDNKPNFGHLTRTCEIFGVRQLVFPNKEILEDDQYQAVSVTAERHIPIEIVSELQLMNFLLMKKGQGYKLMGLEQTSKSQNIVSTQFSDKTVLVLGREQTGIPIEYIEIMDACIQVPQLGEIKSLNMHIQTIICVWEYIKQKSPKV